MASRPHGGSMALTPDVQDALDGLLAQAFATPGAGV